MLSGSLLRVLGVWWLVASGWAVEASTWPIEIDGKKVDAPWYALSDTPEKLAVGDALYVGNENGGLWVCVRDTGNLRFVNRLQSEALLYRQVGAALEAVGFSDAIDAPENEDTGLASLVVRRLAGRPAAVVAGLWGVALDEPQDLAAELAAVMRPATYCRVRAWKREATEADIASLRGFRCSDLWLALPKDRSGWFEDLLSDETRLIAWTGIGEKTVRVDASCFAKAPNLRVLHWASECFENPERLSKLRMLRALQVLSIDEPKSLAWLAELPELRELLLGLFSREPLDVSSLGRLQKLEQLSFSAGRFKGAEAFAALPALERLDLRQTEFGELPAAGFPRLRLLDVLGTKVTPAQVAAFRAAHPECEVVYEWEQALVPLGKWATKLQVFAGGTHVGMECAGPLLFETSDRVAIESLVGLIDVDESAPFRLSHAAAASPALVFSRGGRYATTIGVFCGRSLGCQNEWPHDAQLTESSQQALAKWLAARGVTEPTDDLGGTRVTLDTRDRLDEAFGGALTAELTAGLARAERDSEEACCFQAPCIAHFLEAMERVYPAVVPRALAMLRLIGAEPELSWCILEPRSEALCEQGLAKIATVDLGAAMIAAVRNEDPRIVSGAARFFFRRKGWERFDGATRESLLPALAGWAARSPRDNVRSRLVRALEEIDSGSARAELRRIAGENPAARTLEPNQVPEGGQWKEFGPTDGDVSEGTSVALHAVLALARLGDAQAAALSGKAKGMARVEDADVVARIEAILKDPKLAEADRKTSGEATLGRAQ